MTTKLLRLFSLFSLALIFLQPVYAIKFWKKFKKVKTSSKSELITYQTNQFAKTRFDKDIDEMIFDRLGPECRRANVYDFYPMELSRSKSRFMSHEEKVELMEYYNYARSDLEHISQGKLLKVIKQDFDLDGDYDYAVVVHNSAKNKNQLAIINFKETLFIDSFEANFIEKVNYGRYPTTVIIGSKQRTLYAPSIREVGFDQDTQILYYDRNKQDWRKIELSS